MRNRHRAIAVILGCVCAHSTTAQSYEIVDLGAVAGSTSAVPISMNALGDCVGWSTVVSAPHAFLYTDATGMIDLGNLPGGNVSALARGVNELREVVGESTWVEWRWSPSTGMVEYAPSFWTRPVAINNSGMIVGTLSPGTFFPSPFYYAPVEGVVQFAGAVWGDALDVNESGIVVGTWGGTAGSTYDATTGVSTQLPALPVYPSNYPGAINDRGQVAGNAARATGFPRSTWFRYTPGVGIEDIGLPDQWPGAAHGMNNRGEMVGFKDINPDLAYLYTDQDGFQSLNAMVPPGSGYSLLDAVDINDAGQILCYAYNSSITSFRAVRLDPISLRAAVKSVGTGCAAGSPPKLTGNLPVLGGMLRSMLSNGKPRTTGFLLISAAAPRATDLGAGCTAYFDPSAAMVSVGITTDATGNAAFSTPLPSSGALAGLPLTTQVAFVGTGGPLGIDLSNGFLQRLGN